MQYFRAFGRFGAREKPVATCHHRSVVASTKDGVRIQMIVGANAALSLVAEGFTAMNGF
jgi:hypothetical protein